MTVKEIIKNCCIFLNRDDILKSNVFCEDGEELSDAAQNDLSLLYECLNFIIEEITSEYLPLLKEKTLDVISGKVAIKDIDSSIQDIYSVKNAFDKSVKYNIIDGCILTLAKKVKIVYSVYPKKLEHFDDEISFNGKLSARVIAYGTVSEYSYIQGLYDDASMWETRYKNALMVDARKKSSLYLKERRFI